MGRGFKVEKFNLEKHRGYFEEYDCGVPSLNAYLRLLDSRHATSYLFIDEDKNQLVAYCSFCCSAMQLTEPNIITCVPAIKIEAFALSKFYQNKMIAGDKQKYKYSVVVFDYIINMLKQIARETLYAEVILLHALNKENVIGFYEKMGFSVFRSSSLAKKDIFSSDTDENCVPMYYYL